MKPRPLQVLRYVICLLLNLGICLTGLAQERSFGTLPLLQKPGVPGMSGTSLKDTPEYARALGVYDRLVRARGDFRFPVPTFNLTADERQVAAINYDNLEIILEQKAYQVCAGFGDQMAAAVAFLLSHELTHYYEKHAWRRGFVSDNRDLNIGLRLDSLIDDAANETEADYLGGFLAYSAGYGLFDKGDELIAKLYAAYGLPQKIAGYPSLDDRKAMSERSAEKMARLVEVYDMANLLTAIGRYTEAYEYYRYILMEYQSREIYNNLGITSVLDALQYFNEDELKFRFPLELDLESTGTKGSGVANIRTRILEQAIQHFDAAISLDPSYAPAYLNKASAYALLDDNQRARFYADVEARAVAQKHDYPKTVKDVDILIAILDWREGKKTQAEAAFKSAADAGSALAAHNLKVARGEPLGGELPASGGLSAAEKIDDRSLAQISADPSIDPKRSVSIANRLTFHQNPKQGANSRLYVSQNERTDELIFLHLTNDNYPGMTARKIKLGTGRKEVVKAYGTPKQTLETPRGQIMVYKSIIFVLDEKGNVKRWVNYLV